MISWIEDECDALREQGRAGRRPAAEPVPLHPARRRRLAAALRAASTSRATTTTAASGRSSAASTSPRSSPRGGSSLAEQKLAALTDLVKPARETDVDFGFNEWIKAQDGTPRGQDWQTWSAAMYLYAAACVEQRKTPFLDEIRPAPNSEKDDCKNPMVR